MASQKNAASFFLSQINQSINPQSLICCCCCYAISKRGKWWRVDHDAHVLADFARKVHSSKRIDSFLRLAWVRLRGLGFDWMDESQNLKQFFTFHMNDERLGPPEWHDSYLYLLTEQSMHFNGRNKGSSSSLSSAWAKKLNGWDLQEHPRVIHAGVKKCKLHRLQ